MKATKASIIILIILVITVSFNSYYIRNVSKTLTLRLDAASTSEEFLAIYDSFKKAEKIISLTVSHEDLTNIEDGFAEITGASRVGDEKNVEIVKSRLKESIRHLGRLSGVNLDSIL